MTSFRLNDSRREMLEILCGGRRTAAELSAEEVGEMMRSVGRRLASIGPRPDGERGAEEGVLFLRELGALPSVREEGGREVLLCGCCAIGAVVAEHPEACKAMEAMLAEHLGRPVRERCDRSGRPSCRFELG